MEKAYYYVAVIVGSTIGGYVPVLFGADVFSAWSIFGSAFGALFCLYLAYKYVSG